MTTNMLLGLVMVATGIADISMAKFLAGRLTPVARSLLLVMGVVFTVLGAAISLGYVKAL